MTGRLKFSILLAVDIVMVPVAYATVCWLSLGVLFDQPLIVLIMTIAAAFASVTLGLPRTKLLTYEQNGIQRTGLYGALVGVCGIVSLSVFSSFPIDLMFMLSVSMALIILSVSTRLLIRFCLVAIYKRGNERQRILIYGAGQTGVQLAAALDTDDTIDPVAFIDDDRALQKTLVAGRPVYSPEDLKKLVETQNIQRIVLAEPSHNRPKQARLTRHLESFGCEVSTLPSFASLIFKRPITEDIIPIDPAKFLGREGLDEELADRGDIYVGSSVMVTGAGGSIGAELVRQIINFRPKNLVLFEVNEHALYQLNRELNDVPDLCEISTIVPVLGSVTDAGHVKRTMEKYAVDTVLHTAAYKHVTLVEQNRLPSLYNNVIGTQKTAKAAIETGVSNFILISTDKAVQPTSIMGVSKRFAELLIQDLSTRADGTRFSIVRFGNVLGSSGSVVPLFTEQIAHGGPVTLTHMQATRYFMTISEAVRLVLSVACIAAKSKQQGQVYLLDMGDPVPIRELAYQMIEAAGYSVCDATNPTGDIEISVCGLQPGEKLHEQLAMDGHEIKKTAHPKIKCVDERRLSEFEIASAVRALTKALVSGDEAHAVALLEGWIGTQQRPVEMTKKTAIAFPAKVQSIYS